MTTSSGHKSTPISTQQITVQNVGVPVAIGMIAHALQGTGCVRVLGTPEPTLGALEDTVWDVNRARRLQCIQSRSSRVNRDGGSVDFSRPTFLGIPNPMEFPVIASEWEVSRVVSNLQINVYVGILY